MAQQPALKIVIGYRRHEHGDAPSQSAIQTNVLIEAQQAERTFALLNLPRRWYAKDPT
jgi:hypothetical protein